MEPSGRESPSDKVLLPGQTLSSIPDGLTPCWSFPGQSEASFAAVFQGPKGTQDRSEIFGENWAGEPILNATRWNWDTVDLAVTCRKTCTV